MCASMKNGEGCPVAVRRSELEALKAKVAEQDAEIIGLREESEARLASPSSMSERIDDYSDIGAWAAGVLWGFDGNPVELETCGVRYECVAELTTHDHDRSRRSMRAEKLVFSEPSIEKDRLARLSDSRFIEHIYRYDRIRKVLVFAEDDFGEDLLATTDARRSHLETEARKEADAQAERVAAVARKEAADLCLYEDLRARFENAGPTRN